MNYKNYTFDFTIPQGPTGPTGPTGPIGGSIGLNAYGGRYNTTPATLNLGIGTSTQIPLTSNMPNFNTSYSAANTIEILETGTYEINYFSNVSVALGTTLTLAVRRNGVNIPQTVTSRVLAVGVGSIYSGSIIIDLDDSDIIDIALSALVAVGVTLGNGVNTTLTVKKLD